MNHAEVERLKDWQEVIKKVEHSLKLLTLFLEFQDAPNKKLYRNVPKI